MFKTPQLLLTLCALSVVPFASAWTVDEGQGYINNLTKNPIYGQYKWENKNKCHDSKDGALHLIKPYTKIVDEYGVTDPSRGKHTYCSSILSAYDKDKLLVAQTRINWYLSTDGYRVIFKLHDNTDYCSSEYDCGTYSTNDGNHAYLELRQVVRLGFQNSTNAPLYVNYDHVSGNCNDSVSLDYQKVDPGKSFIDRVWQNGKMKVGVNDFCMYDMNFRSCNSSSPSCQLGRSTVALGLNAEQDLVLENSGVSLNKNLAEQRLRVTEIQTSNNMGHMLTVAPY